MSVLGSLSIKLGIVTQGFDTSINNSKAKINDLNSAVNTVNKTLSMFGVSLGMATAVQGIRTVMNFADEVDDLGKAFDLSTAKVLQFRDALGQSGGKAENAERILGALFDKIETAKNSMVTDDVAKQFAKLGLSIQDLKTMQPEQALTAVFNGLSKIGNTYERVALIKDILGKGGLGLDVKNLAVLMDESASKFEKNAEAITKTAEAADKLARIYEKIKILGAEAVTGFWEGSEVLIKSTLYPFFKEKEQFKPPTIPGEYGGIKAPQSSFTFGAEEAVASAFGKGKQPIREFKLGVAAKDLKEAQVDLEQVIASAERRGKLNIDQLLASKSATTEIKSQLALEKERIQLRSDAYSLSEKDKKIGEIELNRKEQVNHLQKELNDLQLSSDDPMNVKAKEEQLNAQIDMINQLADAEKNLANVEEERRQSFEFGWKSAFMAYAEDAKNASQVGGDVFNSVVGNMGSALDNFVQTGKFSFKDFANSVIQDILRIMMRWQMMQIITGFMGSFGGGMGGKFLGSDLPGLSNVAVKTGLPLKASGGYADRPTIVGENGAELFVPNRPGTIIPNARMNDFMGGGQPQMVVNGTYIANMSAIDTQSAQQFLAKNRTAVFAANQSAMRGLPAGR